MPSLLRRVISGGQSGVDVAGLRAAKAAGLKTGGWMPRGFRTLDGPRPGYAAEFGMREHPSNSYSLRTHRNVAEADATLRIAVDFDSAGEQCTWDAIVEHNKPWLDVDLDVDLRASNVKKVAAWIEECGIVVLNVAGNSERTAPGIGYFAERFLGEVFLSLQPNMDKI